MKFRIMIKQEQIVKIGIHPGDILIIHGSVRPCITEEMLSDNIEKLKWKKFNRICNYYVKNPHLTTDIW